MLFDGGAHADGVAEAQLNDEEVVAPMAVGYHGPAVLTASRGLGSIVFDPVAVLLVVILAASYLAGVRRLRRRGEHWPVGRTLSFLVLGLGTVAGVTMWWVGAYSHVVFWVYAVQIILLLTLAPLGLALGGPLSLAAATLPPRPARVLSAAMGSRIARVVSFPVLSSALLAVFPFLLYFTGWYESTLRNYASYELLHVVLVLVGFVFVWPLAGVDEVPRRLPYGVVMMVGLLELLFDAFPGIVIRLKTHLLAADYYQGLGRPWGHSLIADQRLGGAILWFAGEVAAVPLLVIMGVQWVRTERVETARIDRELDLARVEPRPERGGERGGERGSESGGERGSESGAGREPELDAPWWETDPSRLGSRAERYRPDPPLV